jgi:hypothetical protein
MLASKFPYSARQQANGITKTPPASIIPGGEREYSPCVSL